MEGKREGGIFGVTIRKGMCHPRCLSGSVHIQNKSTMLPMPSNIMAYPGVVKASNSTVSPRISMFRNDISAPTPVVCKQRADRQFWGGLGVSDYQG